MKAFLIILLVKILLISSQFSYLGNCFEYSCEKCYWDYYGACTKCKEGYTLSYGICPCYNYNCAICSSGYPDLNSCILCKDDYITYYNSKSKIRNCKCKIDNCEIYSGSNCLKCEDNYYYDSTIKSCVIQKCDDINCEICPSNEKNNCIRCKKKYYPKDGKCIKIPSYLKCNDIQGYYRYYENNNSCGLICSNLENEDNIFSRQNRCFLCSSIKSTININCERDRYSNIEGCLIYLNDYECYQCKRGYYKKENKCYKCSYGCFYWKSNKECVQCLSGFRLMKDKSCITTSSYDFNIVQYINIQKTLYKIQSNIEVFEYQDYKCEDCDSCFDERSWFASDKCIFCYYNCDHSCSSRYGPECL